MHASCYVWFTACRWWSIRTVVRNTQWCEFGLNLIVYPNDFKASCQVKIIISKTLVCIIPFIYSIFPLPKDEVRGQGKVRFDLRKMRLNAESPSNYKHAPHHPDWKDGMEIPFLFAIPTWSTAEESRDWETIAGGQKPCSNFRRIYGGNTPELLSNRRRTLNK